MSSADSPRQSRPVVPEFVLDDRGLEGRFDEDDLHELVWAVLVDNADAILVVDAGGIVVAANPAAAALFDRSMDRLLGSALGHPVAGNKQVEIEIHATSGARHVELHVGATTWRGEEAHVVTLRNVTERHRADQALRDYVAMTAHEIATPMTTIAGFAETLRMRWSELDESRKEQFIGVIGRQAKRLATIGRDLLALARLDADRTDRQPRPTSLASCVGEVLAEVGPVDAEVDVPEDLVVWCDPAHLATIVRNFLTNAVKYGEPPVRVRGTRVGTEVEFSVESAGDRVPDEFVAHLFTRFARAPDHVRGPEQGTGLGLALSAALAELNGGAVGHRHGDPDGAVFWVLLPATSAVRTAERLP